MTQRSMVEGIKDRFNNMADGAWTYTLDNLKSFGDPDMLGGTVVMSWPAMLLFASFGYAVGGPLGAVAGGLATPIGIILLSSLMEGAIGAVTGLTSGERVPHEEDRGADPSHREP